MYFRQVEVSGFKSFADRTVVRLEQGVTAIVGPNGCGKSNILDSLRWALGEQNARELRGHHMMDVIFNGSENRQPLGMAEVSVTFDNSDSRLPIDFSEVQVTRRIYRSGESEYMINKTPCRLRDIQELFMDTGIGTSAYSLIGQGKIDLVLSSKPEDRRFLFEEAAGIIKYKARKRVAMRKLEAAEQNLVRLNDIIAEVQRQMRSLKRQVNAAIRYRELKDALRDLEIRSMWIKYVYLKDAVASLKEQFAVAQNEYEKAMTETATFDARNEDLALKRITGERLLNERREGLHQIDAEMEKVERQIALLRQQIDFLKEQQQKALSERADFSDRATAMEQQAIKTAEFIESLERDMQERKATIEAKQAQYAAAQTGVTDAEAALQSARTRAVDAMNLRAKAQTELETLAVNIRNAETRLEAIRDRRQNHDQRNEDLSGQLNTARETESQTLDALQTVVDGRKQASDENAARTQAVREMMEERQTLREKKSSQEARLTSLRELRDSYEGFAVGVRAIMMAKQRNMPEVNGVIGPVGDVLSTQKTYEQAIEAALGGNVNNVIVEEAESAKSAIAFLKQHRAGRVTFLPLDTIRVNTRDDCDTVKGLSGVIGRAIDYVSFEPRLGKAIEYLLFNTVVVKTLDDAIRIARTQDRFPRLVTLDGEFVSPAGAVTGGQTKNDSHGLLGRSAEISELEQQVKSAETRLAVLTQKADALTAQIEQCNKQIQEFHGQEAALRKTLNETGVIIARLSTEFESLSQSSRQLEQEATSIETERSRFEQRRVEVAAQAEALAKDDATLQQDVVNFQESAEHARRSLEAAAAELSELRVTFAGLTERLEEARRNQTREQSEREEAIRSAQRRMEQAGQFGENERNLESEIAAHIERARQLADSKEEARQKAVEAQEQLQALVQEIDELSKTLRETHERTRATQSEVHKLEIDLRHDEDQLAFLEERVIAEYHITLASLDAEQVGEDEHDDQTREDMVAELRDKIERMGQVNVMAIEEYEALEKRNEFLVSQEEDLRKARETLLGIVARIDMTIRDMFMETFNSVAENFSIFFRRLFNGGQAHVYLTNPDDPLESGIEIEARPPGKKPQGISLLSGGEQAMTAIALLFSIFKSRPSPFCVLDEVDAPLDDANIGRFLNMVDEFTTDSQFIIITHNKQTMAKANVLYGVTMPERGVSQLVSVKFDEKPKNETAA